MTTIQRVVAGVLLSLSRTERSRSWRVEAHCSRAFAICVSAATRSALSDCCKLAICARMPESWVAPASVPLVVASRRFNSAIWRPTCWLRDSKRHDAGVWPQLHAGAVYTVSPCRSSTAVVQRRAPKAATMPPR